MLRIDSVVKFASRAAHKDFSYTIFYDSLWSVLENTLGIINCTLPLMPPVIKNIADSKLWQSLSSQASRLNPRGYGSRSGNSSKRPKNTRHYDRDIESSFKPFPPAVKNMKPLGSHSGDMYPLTSLSTGSVSGVEHPFPELIQKSATG